MDLQNTRLMLVYNADGGIISMLKDAIHKQVSPATYPCSLCALTYGLVEMKGEWKRYWRALDAEVVFHHRDDFTAAYRMLGTGGPREVALPCVLVAEASEEPRVLIAAQELDTMADLEELMARVSAALSPA